jgi:hypothetical protein
MNISMKTFKEEIDRAFAELGAERGFGRNVEMITMWKESGFISDEEYKILRQYNRVQFHEMD